MTNADIEHWLKLWAPGETMQKTLHPRNPQATHQDAMHVYRATLADGAILRYKSRSPFIRGNGFGGYQVRRVEKLTPTGWVVLEGVV